MSVVGINEGSGLLSEVPKPPAYMTNSAKKHYKEFARRLIKIKRLKEVYLPALEIFAESYALWEFTTKKIRDAEKIAPGSGYFVTYKNNVVQNSTWFNQQQVAIKRLNDCFKQFGLEPAADKSLAPAKDPNQLNFFEELKKKLAQGA